MLLEKTTSQDYLFLVLRNIVLGMTFLYLGVDCLNGIFLRMGIGISISQLYKMGLLAGMLLYLLKSHPTNFGICLIMIFFFLGPSMLKSLSTGDTSTIVGNFGYNLKLLLYPISFLFFSSLSKTDWGQNRLYTSFVWFNFALIAVNILLGVVGVGYSQYDGPDGGGIGGRGFFFAGNEVASIFVLFSGTCWHMIRHKGFVFKLLFFGLLLILGILNASKTAVLGILIIIMLLEINLRIPRNITLSQLFKFLTIPVLLAFIPFLLYVGIQSTGLINRISFFYERMDLLTFILSGRNQMVMGAMKFYPTEYSLWDYLFGLGYKEFLDEMGTFHGVAHAIEIDFFDLLFMNGWLGLGLIMGAFGLILIRSAMIPRESLVGHMWAINLVLLLISFMAGHVFNSGMLGIALGFLNGLPTLTNRS